MRQCLCGDPACQSCFPGNQYNKRERLRESHQSEIHNIISSLTDINNSFSEALDETNEAIDSAITALEEF